MIRGTIRFLDQRAGAGAGLGKALRYVFPDHWTFLLGEIALYSFLILVATGRLPALFFEPTSSQIVYHGSYAPLQGAGDVKRLRVDPRPLLQRARRAC